MTIWEAMTEDAREYITNNFCGKDSSIDEVIEFFRFDEEFLQSEADSYQRKITSLKSSMM